MTLFVTVHSHWLVGWGFGVDVSQHFPVTQFKVYLSDCRVCAIVLPTAARLFSNILLNPSMFCSTVHRYVPRI